jgi:branched-subunit amino acid ABC-type transport system permease component
MGIHILIGIVNGSIYALLALGILLMYQTTGVLNFAFGAFGMIAAYLFYVMADAGKLGVSVVVSFFVILILAIPAGALIGWVTLPVQRLSRIVKAAVALGLFSAIQGLVLIIWPPEPRATPTLVGSVAIQDLFGVAISWQRLIAIGVAVGGSIAMLAFFRWSSLGSALRAMASSTEISTLVGLPIRRLWVVAWMLSTFVAAVAILVILPDLGLSVGSLSFVIFTPLAAVLAARFESIPIALGSAFALGILQSVFQSDESLAQYREVLPFALVMVALLLQPTKGTYERV